MKNLQYVFTYELVNLELIKCDFNGEVTLPHVFNNNYYYYYGCVHVQGHYLLLTQRATYAGVALEVVYLTLVTFATNVSGLTTLTGQRLFVTV